MEKPDNILEVCDLKVWFPVRKGVFGLTDAQFEDLKAKGAI